MPIFKRHVGKSAIPVKDVMTSPVITVEITSSLHDVVDLMWKKNIGCLVVIDSNSKLAGIITERDILYACSKDLFNDGGRAKAETVMSRNVIASTPDDNLDSVVEKMRSHNIRHIPILDASSRPVGVVSFRDIVDVSIGLLGLLTPPDLG